MNGTDEAMAIVARQKAHARHARILEEATPLSPEILGMPLVGCIEQQAARFPHRLALATEKGSLTYQALNEATNRLAHHLLAMGIAATAPVLIMLESSLDTVVSILAVLKAGGYHLCLEPTLPVQRARDLLNRAVPQLILTTSAFAAYVDEVAPAGSERLLLDQIVAGNLVHNPPRPSNPSQLVRVGFTSGSTGAPKPSVKTHTTYLYDAWQNSNSYLLGPADRHAFVYQFSTGISMRVLFCALLTGGSVHLHPGAHSDMSSWAAWIEAKEITQLSIPTAAFRELLHTRPDGGNFPSVRMVYISGQSAYRQDAELFQRRFCQGTILVSRFGMSETSGLTHYLVDHDTQFEGDTLPAGYALPGRELLIVDEEGRPLGFNQPGEIVVRNLFANVRDALPTSNEERAGNTSNTANDAQGAGDESAFFYTSDLGLVRPDGCLIHLGRKDDMVKVRGNRVALAEAESLLLKVGGLAQAAIKPFPTANGDNRLVGYVTLAAGAHLTDVRVREEMSLLAPVYMVPARIVVLQAMPLTASGKVDRQALPAPGSTRPDLRTPFVAPSNETEEKIASIWAELLDLDKIGINDNFFEVGGDSISAMRMILKVEAATGATVPQDYFRGPTVAALAAYCTAGIAVDASVEPNSIFSDSMLNEAELDRRTRLRRPVWARLANGEVTTHTVLRKLIYERLRGLAYPQGIQWLAWLGRPAIANRLFSRERTYFAVLAQELNSPAAAARTTLDRAFSISILGNLIRDSFQRSWLYRQPDGDNLIEAMLSAPERFWRSFAQRLVHSEAQLDQDKDQPLFRFNGLEHLVQAQRQSKGAILVTYHSTANALANAILAHRTSLGQIPTISLERTGEIAEEEWSEEKERWENDAASWAAISALQAQRILQQGGVIRIVNDISYDAANSRAKTIGRRQYNLKPGFAELALMTGAAVLPIYSAFDASGRIFTSILPALTSQAGDPARYVDDLLNQYIAFLEATWRKSPESMGWGTLRRYTTRPPATAPTRAEPSVIPLAVTGRS